MTHARHAVSAGLLACRSQTLLFAPVDVVEKSDHITGATTHAIRLHMQLDARISWLLEQF